MKDIKLIQCSQKLKASITLLMSNGKQLRTAHRKLNRWCKHLMQVSNVSVWLKGSVLDSVLMPGLGTLQVTTKDESLACVPSEDEIRVDLNVMKNGRAPGKDDMLDELLKPAEELVVQ